MKKIMISVGELRMEAELNETSSAEKIFDALPISCAFNVWGDEFYFSIPVNDDLSTEAKEVVELGDLAFWPPGQAFCIFYGKTPASVGDEIRPASAVNVVGRLLGDPREFKKVASASMITLEAQD